MTCIVSLEDLAATIAPAALLAVPADYSGVAMAATAALVRRGTGGLNLLCVPVSGLQADMLIGKGLVATIETSAVTLGEAGGAPRFQAAAREGSLILKDATCPATHAALLAAQKGVPFMPIRGIIGSDVLAHRSDWKIIDNPFPPHDPIIAIPAISPDVALFHAPEADRFGNVRIGRRRELATMAYAAKTTLVTVERISETSLLADERDAAGVLPALYVSQIAVAERGAWPLGLWGEYKADGREIARYAQMARTPEGFRTYMTGFTERTQAAA
ncbi:MAG: CoA transferase [Beijerinckiaceae bacterium]